MKKFLSIRQQGLAATLTALIGISACGGGGGSNATQQTAVLLDSAVSTRQ